MNSDRKIKYYTGERLLNHYCPINMSSGNRTGGKSFYWKRYCLRQFFKTEREFLYLRRHETDLDLTIDSFFEDISPEFPGKTLIHKKDTFRAYNLNTHGDKVLIDKCGYTGSLNTSIKLKSIPKTKVDTIFFDEFIPDDMRFLKPNNPAYEPELIFSIYLTVARGFNRPIRDEVKAILVSNVTSDYNPYYTYFGIDLRSAEYQVVNYVYAEKVMIDDARDAIMDSKIGKIMQGTRYGNYAMNNTPLYNYDIHIAQPPQKSHKMFQLYSHKWYCAYADLYNDILYFTDTGFDKTFKTNYKMTDVESQYPIPWFRGDVVKYVRKMVESDKVRFSSGDVKIGIYGYFNKEAL